MLNDLEKCIIELKKPESERNIPIIVKYIRELNGLMTILHETNEDFNFYLNECAKIIKYNQRETNDIIVEQGDKGDSFFLLLKGSVSFLVSRPTNYEMTFDDYLLHLFKLRKNNSNELLRQCIQLNEYTYSVGENFDLYLKNIYFNIETLKNKFILNKAKELYELIKGNHIKKNITNMSVKEYIERNKVDEEIFNKNKFQDEEKEKNTVRIPNYILIGQSNKGETFGELALEQNSGKRQATVITNEPTDFAIIYRNDYNNLLKSGIEKAKKKFFNVINSYNIFQKVTPYALEKKYYKLFNLRKLEKGFDLIEQNKENDCIYFIIDGDFEVITNRNIKEVNDLIIYYKKFIRKFGSKSDYKLYNPEEELRENDDLIMNKKFKSKEQNEILFQRNNIKLNLFQDREILGVNNLMSSINESISKGLVNCKTVSNNSQVYELERKQFSFICEFEDGVLDYTIEYEINKMKMAIQRLQIHKKRIYNLINNKEKEYSDQAFQIKIRDLKFKQKNRVRKLEANQIIENEEMKSFIEQIEKEKENKRKMMENEKKKKKNNYFYFNTKNVHLPYINNSNGNLFSIKKNKNDFLNKVKVNLIGKNLYENTFNSYVLSNDNNKSELETEKVNKSINGVYDVLIFDRFNSCYKNALNNIKYSK